MLKQTKEISLTTYTARDGKEFASEEACLEYEEYLASEERYEKAKKYIAALKVDVSDDNFPFIPLSEFAKENGNISRIKTNMRHSVKSGNYQYYHLNSKEDLLMLAEVVAHDSYAKVAAEDVVKSAGKLNYPCTVICGFSYGWGREIGSFAKEMKLIEKYCKLNGYAVEVDKDRKEE